MTHYVNANKVIEPELGNIEASGLGKTKMLSKTKKISVLKSNMDIDDGYALMYTCATDWWFFLLPRKTETSWIISRKQSVEDLLYNDLKTVLKDQVSSYDVDEKWGSHTLQGGDCKYNSVLSLKRAADAGGNDSGKNDPTGGGDIPVPVPNPDNNNDDGKDVVPVVPDVPKKEDTKASTDPASSSKTSSGNETLMLIIGILTGSLVTVLLALFLCRRKNDKDGAVNRLLINGSAS